MREATQADTASKVLGGFKHPANAPVNVLLACLEDHRQKRMTMDQLTIECYNWSYHYALTEMACKPYPMTPDYMVRFRSWPRKKQRKMLEEDKDTRNKVLEFRGKWLSIQWNNKANLEWLLAMKAAFKANSEYDKVAKLERTIETYEGETY